MSTAYARLFSVLLRHSYYTDERSTSDFIVLPTPATRRSMEALGLVSRTLDDGVALYAQVDPSADLAVLWKSMRGEALRLAFVLQPVNPFLFDISDLPRIRPSAQIFYVNNLSEDVDDGRLYLADSVANARVGDPLTLVTSAIYAHAFASPVSSATLTLEDLFGNRLYEAELAFAEPVTEYRLELSAVPKLSPGRYVLSDDLGGRDLLYYDSELFGLMAFGIVEVYSRTDPLTPDSTDLVPDDYRFLQDDELTGNGDYYVQLESRATKWRYNVSKSYDSNDITLAGLTITGDVAFTKTLVDERAIFTSDDSIPLRQVARTLSLEHDGTRVRDVPSPGPGTQVSAGSSADELISDMYLYV